jgi:hypothetical protein
MSSSTAGINTVSPDAVDLSTGTANKTSKSTLETFKEKLIGVKNFVLAHKEGCGNLGQITSGTCLTLGAAALVFSGIAASLTVGGIPLAIPLLVAGGILFAGGSALKVAAQIEKKDDSRSIGEKIEKFFKDTFNNLKTGITAGVVGTVPLVFFSVSEIILALPFIVATVDFLKSDASSFDKKLDKVESTAPSKFKKVISGLRKVFKEAEKASAIMGKAAKHFETNPTKKPEQTTDNSTTTAAEDNTGK